MDEKKQNIRHVLLFLIFSASAGVIQTITFTVLYEIVEFVYWPSYLFALLLSVLWNFTLNRKFTFKSAANIPIAMFKVAFFYAVFIPLSTWSGDSLTGNGSNPYLVLFGTMIANLILEFLYTKYFIYRNQINTANQN
jgi:putative flippase GtrA